MFKEALERAVTGTDGSIAGLLMDFEGIPLESYTRDGAAHDIEVVGAEVSVVVKAIQRATEMLDARGNERGFVPQREDGDADPRDQPGLFRGHDHVARR